MPKSIFGLPGAFYVRPRTDLRQGRVAYAWHVTAVITADRDAVRVVVNAMRDAGAAMELTSTAYQVANYPAALAKAQAMAQAHGCLKAHIVGSPDPFLTPPAPCLAAA